MPPPGSGAQPLSIDEKMLFARWIDLGAPIDTAELRGNPGMGWFLDDQRPTLHISQPRPNQLDQAPRYIRYSFADANSGLNLSTLSVRTSFSVQGRSANVELKDLAVDRGGQRFEIDLGDDFQEDFNNAHIWIEIADQQGNITRLDRRFSAPASSLLLNDSFESP